MIFYILIIVCLNLSYVFPHGEDHSHDDNHTHQQVKYDPIGVIRGSVVDSMLDESKVYANVSVVKEDSDNIVETKKKVTKKVWIFMLK